MVRTLGRISRATPRARPRPAIGARGLASGAVRRLVAAGLSAILLVGLFGVAPTRAGLYDRFYANFAGEELMRAINADRRARGLPALASDSTLEGIARDRALVCPSNNRLTIRGRARDMAERDYLSHNIKGCSTGNGSAFDAFDLLRAFGYSYDAAAETIASNNYPSNAVTYRTGCAIGGSSCNGSIVVPRTVAVAERSFMNSSSHRAILLSSGYGRFGCAAWASGSGNHFFACYLVRSGSGQLDGTGPLIANVSGVGATFRAGATPTFTATASDRYSVLSDGYATIDGVRIRAWAWDHAGLSAKMAVEAPSLKAGSHTFRWWVRDASTRHRSVSFQFYVTR
jgi:uncharacterized protein YkwD